MIHRCTKHNFTFELQSLYTVSQKKESELLGKMASSRLWLKMYKINLGYLNHFKTLGYIKKNVIFI